MARGKAASVGDTRVSANGYHYTRTETEWRLTHHIIAEQKLGRPLADDERAVFVDKDRRNLDPRNIFVAKRGKSNLRRRRAQIEARIDELKGELAWIEKQLGE